MKARNADTPSEAGYACPQCQSACRVFNTRARNGHVWRRRECLVCGHRFSTTEAPTADQEALERLVDLPITLRRLAERVERALAAAEADRAAQPTPRDG